MAESQLHATTETKTPERGHITASLLEWQPSCVGPYAWSAKSGPEAASVNLLKAHALTACLAAAFDDSGKPNSEFDALVGSYKSLAMEGIGDLILLAKLLTDDA
jgi:hypothetical protein